MNHGTVPGTVHGMSPDSFPGGMEWRGMEVEVGHPYLSGHQQKIKACNRCLQELPLDSFYRNHKAADGRQSCCIACRKRYDRENAETIAVRQLAYQRRLRGATPRPVRIPEVSESFHKMLWRYGLSLRDYEWLLISQAFRCAICHRDVDLCIDHDHDTGVVRGLLCNRCNSGLGMFGDGPQLLDAALDYVRHPPHQPRRPTRLAAAGTSPPPMDARLRREVIA